MVHEIGRIFNHSFEAFRSKIIYIGCYQRCPGGHHTRVTQPSQLCSGEGTLGREGGALITPAARVELGAAAAPGAGVSGYGKRLPG